MSETYGVEDARQHGALLIEWLGANDIEANSTFKVVVSDNAKYITAHQYIRNDDGLIVIDPITRDPAVRVTTHELKAPVPEAMKLKRFNQERRAAEGEVRS